MVINVHYRLEKLPLKNIHLSGKWTLKNDNNQSRFGRQELPTYFSVYKLLNSITIRKFMASISDLNDERYEPIIPIIHAIVNERHRT